MSSSSVKIILLLPKCKEVKNDFQILKKPAEAQASQFVSLRQCQSERKEKKYEKQEVSV